MHPTPMEVSDAPELVDAKVRAPRTTLLLVVGIFFITSFAVLPLLSHYRGDERFYTDAAIRMVHTGDWITPYYADGSMRFRKPILPYWIVAVPFELFGVGVVSSRIGALLAAVAMLLLTYGVGTVLTRDRRAAALAVAMLAANLNVLNMSTRATTDTLQAACAALALYGLARLTFGQKRDAASYACFWIGVGLVAASKGGLAIVTLFFAFGFVAARGRALGRRMREIIHWPTMLLGLAIGLGWFAALLVKHGHLAWADFWSDQVGSRLAGGRFVFIQNLPAYAVAVVLDFLPWAALLLVAAVGQWSRVRAFVRENLDSCLFAGGWYVLLVVVFAFGNIQRNRYCLPSYPLIAVIASALLLELWENPRAVRRSAVFAGTAFVGTALVGLVLALVGWRVHPLVSFGGGVTAGIAILAWLIWWRGRALADPNFYRHGIGFGLFLVLIFRTNDLLTRQPLFPASGPALWNALEKHAAGADRVAAIGIAPGRLAQVRLLSGGLRDIDSLPADAEPELLNAYDAILLGGSQSVPLPPEYRLAPAGVAHQGWRVTDLAAVCFGFKTTDEILKRRTTPYELAWRATPATHSTQPPRAIVPPTGAEDDED